MRADESKEDNDRMVTTMTRPIGARDLTMQTGKLAKLADGPVPAGRHERTWDSSRAAAGVYFVRFEAPGFHAERRLVVIR